MSVEQPPDGVSPYVADHVAGSVLRALLDLLPPGDTSLSGLTPVLTVDASGFINQAISKRFHENEKINQKLVATRKKEIQLENIRQSVLAESGGCNKACCRPLPPSSYYDSEPEESLYSCQGDDGTVDYTWMEEEADAGGSSMGEAVGDNESCITNPWDAASVIIDGQHYPPLHGPPAVFPPLRLLRKPVVTGECLVKVLQYLREVLKFDAVLDFDRATYLHVRGRSMLEDDSRRFQSVFVDDGESGAGYTERLLRRARAAGGVLLSFGKFGGYFYEVLNSAAPLREKLEWARLLGRHHWVVGRFTNRTYVKCQHTGLDILMSVEFQLRTSSGPARLLSASPRVGIFGGWWLLAGLDSQPLLSLLSPTHHRPIPPQVHHELLQYVRGVGPNQLQYDRRGRVNALRYFATLLTRRDGIVLRAGQYEPPTEHLLERRYGGLILRYSTGEAYAIDYEFCRNVTVKQRVCFRHLPGQSEAHSVCREGAFSSDAGLSVATVKGEIRLDVTCTYSAGFIYAPRVCPERIPLYSEKVQPNDGVGRVTLALAPSFRRDAPLNRNTNGTSFIAARQWEVKHMQGRGSQPVPSCGVLLHRQLSPRSAASVILGIDGELSVCLSPLPASMLHGWVRYANEASPTGGRLRAVRVTSLPDPPLHMMALQIHGFTSYSEILTLSSTGRAASGGIVTTPLGIFANQPDLFPEVGEVQISLQLHLPGVLREPSSQKLTDFPPPAVVVTGVKYLSRGVAESVPLEFQAVEHVTGPEPSGGVPACGVTTGRLDLDSSGSDDDYGVEEGEDSASTLVWTDEEEFKRPHQPQEADTPESDVESIPKKESDSDESSTSSVGNDEEPLEQEVDLNAVQEEEQPIPLNDVGELQPGWGIVLHQRSPGSLLLGVDGVFRTSHVSLPADLGESLEFRDCPSRSGGRRRLTVVRLATLPPPGSIGLHFQAACGDYSSFSLIGDANGAGAVTTPYLLLNLGLIRLPRSGSVTVDFDLHLPSVMKSAAQSLSELRAPAITIIRISYSEKGANDRPPMIEAGAHFPTDGSKDEFDDADQDSVTSDEGGEATSAEEATHELQAEEVLDDSTGTYQGTNASERKEQDGDVPSYVNTRLLALLVGGGELTRNASLAWSDGESESACAGEEDADDVGFVVGDAKNDATRDLEDFGAGADNLSEGINPVTSTKMKDDAVADTVAGNTMADDGMKDCAVAGDTKEAVLGDSTLLMITGELPSSSTTIVCEYKGVSTASSKAPE